MQIMPESISSYGPQFDSLTLSITVLVGIFFVIAQGILLYFALRYRKTESNKKASYLNGVGWSQARWIFIPAVIVFMGDVFIDVSTSTPWAYIKKSTPPSEVYVRVLGQQYSWIFTYPNETTRSGEAIQSANELHVPIGKTITFDLEAKDVLHGFWVPSLRLKQDVVPGRATRGWFEATKTGTYDIACSEICGVGHTIMKGSLVVHTEEDYQAWLASKRKEMAEDSASSEAENANATAKNADSNDVTVINEAGHKLAQTKGCLACHSVDGSRSVGPSWKGLYGHNTKVSTNGKLREVLADEEFIKKSILDPMADIAEGFPAAMPPQRANLTDKEVTLLVKYIKNLGDAHGADASKENK